MLQQSQNESVEEFAAEELRIILTAYSKVAKKRLIDAVPQVIENSFIQGQPCFSSLGLRFSY